MSLNNKQLATLVLGAAAAFGAYKYSRMTEEEKQKLSENLKSKLNRLKDEAGKAGDMLKQHFPTIEKQFSDLFKSGTKI